MFNYHFNLNLRNKGNSYLRPMKDFNMAFLPAKPFCFRSHGHAMDADAY